MVADFTGSWKADLSQSRLLGPCPQSMTMDFMHSEPELRQEITVTKADGSEQRIKFKCVTNGEPDQSRLDGKDVRGRAHWQDEELIIELWIQNGPSELYLCDCWSLSADGQTLTWNTGVTHWQGR